LGTESSCLRSTKPLKRTGENRSQERFSFWACNFGLFMLIYRYVSKKEKTNSHQEKSDS
jgi:hypothetical protein